GIRDFHVTGVQTCALPIWFREANTDIMVVGRKVGSLFVVLFPAIMLILNVTVVGVIWFGGIQVDAGEVQIGTLFAFMQYVMIIQIGRASCRERGEVAVVAG